MNQPIITELPVELSKLMQASHVWSQQCPVPLHRLSLIQKICYVDFEDREHDDGELVSLDIAAPNIAQLFSTLHQRRFPIAKIKLIHHYAGDDEKSMADNNTSCFNFRTIAGTDLLSLHSYGLAVDINPLQNPMVYLNEVGEITSISPQAGSKFLNRNNQQPGMVESIVSLFKQHGFPIWGGSWTNPLDYQHFQLPRDLTERLITLNKDEAQRLFNAAISKTEF